MTDSPKISAKHVDVQVHMQVSVGTPDRQRSIEDFEADIVKAMREVVGAHNVTVSRPYYILDGKVCLPEDYDPATGNFKEGAVPPAWAGGPSDEERRRKDQEARRRRADEVEEAPTRKVRSDKGKSRKKKATPEEVMVSAEDLKEAMTG